MKTKLLPIILIAAIISVPALAEEKTAGAFLGVELYDAPELLVKHLGLEPGQGQVIKNIFKNSPAEKAGLDKDDILLEMNGKKIVGQHEFVQEMRNSKPSAKITLKVMQAGKKKDITLQLGQMPADFDAESWKYEQETTGPQITRQGKIYKFEPDKKNWKEMFGAGRVVPQTYMFRHDEDGIKCSVTIKGNPADENSKIIINSDNNKYETLIGQLDKLPEDYRKIALKYITKAQELAEDNMYHFEYDVDVPHINIPDVDVDIPNLNNIQEQLQPYVQKMNEGKDKQIEKMNDNMEKLKEQVKQLQEKLDKLLNRTELDDDTPSPKPESQPKKQTSSSDKGKI